MFLIFQEREAEKVTEEVTTTRDVKPEITPARSPESWHGSAFYRHLNILKGIKITKYQKHILPIKKNNNIFLSFYNLLIKSTRKNNM